MAADPIRKIGRRTRRRSIRTQPDRARDKRFPNSLRLLVVSLQQYWLQEIGRQPNDALPPLSKRKFLAAHDFMDCYLQTLDLYRGIARPQKKAISGAFEDMATGNCDMEYYKIRALAHYTRLHSAALVLLLCQLIGEERRARGDQRNAKQACEQILDGILRVIHLTKERLGNIEDPDADLFMKKYDDTKDGYLPDMSILRAWRDAFNNGSLPPDPINTPPSPERTQ
jgi:hypothetical protein